jgi:hypothetical protein
MKFEELTPTLRAVLEALTEAVENGLRRSELVEILCVQGPYKMPVGTISSSLNRLEAFGLIERPTAAGGPWLVTAEGMALLAGAPEPEPEPDPAPDPEPEKSALPWAVEQALWELKARLTGETGIPPTTLFVYHSVLETLPEALQRELHPLTARLPALARL